MTAEELLKHPEYNHTIWDLKPEKQGKAAVAKDRGGPINIAYEVHGHGNRHLVVSEAVHCSPLPITPHLVVSHLQHDPQRVSAWLLFSVASSESCHVSVQSHHQSQSDQLLFHHSMPRHLLYSLLSTVAFNTALLDSVTSP